MSTHPQPPAFHVGNNALGKCVTAARDLVRGDVIATTYPTPSPERSRHTMEVEADVHVILPPPIELLNHSCEPNCGLLLRGATGLAEVHALRAIPAGEELTFDYASFESDIQFMTGPCLCGAPSCRGRITGYPGLPEHRRRALGPYVAAHLRESEVLEPVESSR